MDRIFLASILAFLTACTPLVTEHSATPLNNVSHTTSSNSSVYDFENVPLQQGLKRLTVGLLLINEFDLPPGSTAYFDIKDQNPPAGGISGRHLQTQGSFQLDITTTTGPMTVEFDAKTSIPEGATLFVLGLSDSPWMQPVYSKGPAAHYSVTKLGPGYIRSINGVVNSGSISIDNLTLIDQRYEDPYFHIEKINTRYRDTADRCPDGKPAYYCNGVVIRSVDNGNFNPWDPSPAAEKLGAISFSYLRSDVKVSNLYNRAGFIFYPQTEALARNEKVDYLCAYAYDAGTNVGSRPGKGCGLKPRSATNADLSTCASVNVRSAAEWQSYTRNLASRDYQCSLSTVDANQFAITQQVRANRPPNIGDIWNELLIDLWPQNHGAQLPIEAFYYKLGDSVSLSDAKTFQTKLKKTAGRWVPIYALDFTKMDSKPFSFNRFDQAVLP